VASSFSLIFLFIIFIIAVSPLRSFIIIFFINIIFLRLLVDFPGTQEQRIFASRSDHATTAAS